MYTSPLSYLAANVTSDVTSLHVTSRCCHFAAVTSRVTSRVTSLCMADPFEFRKDGHLLAVLSGVSQLGAFTTLRPAALWNLSCNSRS